MSGKPRQSAQAHQFSCHKDIHRIIFAKGDKAVSFKVHPVIATIGVVLILALGLAYLGATGYLVFRDNILNALQTRQIRIQNQYEDQMAGLRIEIDRITSRQMLDQKTVEGKINRLLGLSESITERKKSVDSLVQAASAAGISVPQTQLHSDASASGFTQNGIPTPRPRPGPKARHADLIYPGTPAQISSAYTTGNEQRAGQEAISNHIRTAPISELDFHEIEQNLQYEEANQVHQLRVMATKTSARARKITSVLHSIGAKPPIALPNTLGAIGGPFEEVKPVDLVAFNSSILALEENLTAFNELKSHIQRFPLAKPLRNAAISSHFGRRIDPFLGRYANHAGLDFSANSGARVFATGPGRVVSAGSNGGYGLMVEIEHAGGVNTRYAHLSRIHVKRGQQISLGDVIGLVGSTGRSTGPHLHYETRIHDRAVNPIRFIKAGKHVQSALN